MTPKKVGKWSFAEKGAEPDPMTSDNLIFTNKYRNFFLSPLFAMVLIIFAAVAIYSNTYHCPFVFDDIHSIVENSKIRDLSRFFNWSRLLHSRKMVDLSFALNYRFGRLDVFGYHLVNILIHIANGFIVYFLAMTILGQVGLTAEDGRLNGRGLKTEGSGQRAAGGRRKGKSKDRGAKKKGKKEAGITELKRSSPPNPQTAIRKQLSTIPLISLFTALIFVVHPIQTQAVTYIVQRYASMAAFFYMASVLFYLRGRVAILRTDGKGFMAEEKKLPPSAFSLRPCLFYLLSFVCGLLAFMSKQNAASLPGAIILVEYICFGGTWKQWARRILWIAPAVALFILFVLYNMGAFSGADIGQMLEDVSGLARETDRVSRWEYLCTQFNVLVIYIRLLFIPVAQNLDYLYPFTRGFFFDLTPYAFGFLISLVIMAVWKRKLYPVVTIAVFWFFITLSVESSIIPIRDALFEHRLYLAMFGFALFAAWAPFRVLPKKRLFAVFLCLVMITSLGTATYLRNRVWQDGLTLWADVMAKSPHNARAENNFANNLSLLKKDFARATAYYKRLLKLNPSDKKVRVNLGTALGRQKKYKEAIDEFYAVLRIDPLNAEALYNLGVVFMRQGNVKKAIDNFSKTIRVRPRFASAHYNLGLMLVKQKKLTEAVGHFLKAIRVNPDHADAHYQLGLAYVRMGNLEDAIHHFFESSRLDPELRAGAYYNSACGYALNDKSEQAIEYLKMAIDSGFNDWARIRTDEALASIRKFQSYQVIIADH